MLNRKLTPTFTHVFENGDCVTIQYETEYNNGLHINELKYVFHKGENVTHFFLYPYKNGYIDDTPAWMYQKIEMHSKIIWSEQNREPMQLITERYKTL